MKILHVASFRGNIGDNANHAGFRPWFEALLGRPAEWVNFEIRDVYRKRRAFDETFAAQANECSLVVWGGGNYFELWVEQSPTGTSLSIPDETLTAIRRPMLFNALGVDDAQGYTTETLSRFRRFLKVLLSSEQYLVTVRNDGAMEALRIHAADLPIHRVLPVPDGGFFAGYEPIPHDHIGPRIGINIAGDMPGLRFAGGDRHTFESFLAELGRWMTHRVAQDTRTTFVLFPHIYSDLKPCTDLLSLLPDEIRRERVRVASYDNGDRAAVAVFGEYGACDVVLGMRFHANVVPIGQGVPAVGLCCYAQVRRLYDELGVPEYCIDVTQPGYSSNISSLVDRIIGDPCAASRRTRGIQSELAAQRRCQAAAVSQWLSHHQFIRS